MWTVSWPTWRKAWLNHYYYGMGEYKAPSCLYLFKPIPSFLGGAEPETQWQGNIPMRGGKKMAFKQLHLRKNTTSSKHQKMLDEDLEIRQLAEMLRNHGSLSTQRYTPATITTDERMWQQNAESFQHVQAGAKIHSPSSPACAVAKWGVHVNIRPCKHNIRAINTEGRVTKKTTIVTSWPSLLPACVRVLCRSSLWPDSSLIGCIWIPEHLCLPRWAGVWCFNAFGLICTATHTTTPHHDVFSAHSYTYTHYWSPIPPGSLFTSGMVACLEAACQLRGNPNISAVSIVLEWKLV